MPSDHAIPPELITLRDEVSYEAFSIHVGLRLDAFLARHMTWRSRTSIKKLIAEGKVALERRGERTTNLKSSTTIVDRDRIHVKLPKPKRDLDAERDDLPDDPALLTVYEDRWLVALDKPPNVPVHPAGRNLYRTVITSLHKRYRDLEDPERDIVPKLCHRLDLETSGVLLVAKDDRAHREVSRMIRERVPSKEYLAIVHGVPEPRQGLIDLPLGPSYANKVYQSRAVRFDVGQEARTGYEVVQTFGAFSLLRLQLYTGRPHQIRVHCAAIGHHLVGDKIYGDDEGLFLRYYAGEMTDDDRAALMLPRHALHAHRLTLPHPITKEPLDLTAPLPPDLRLFVQEHGGAVETTPPPPLQPTPDPQER